MDITATDFLRKATETAEHFGFVPLSQFKKESLCKNCREPFTHKASASDRKQDSLYGLLTNSINAYSDYKLYALEKPVLYYNIEPVPRSGEVSITLQACHIDKSIAEAMLIQTTRAITRDIGYTNSTVRINSMGDSDSSARYTRELNNFFRKRLDQLPPQAREILKDQVMATLMHLIDKKHELAVKSPNSLEYLSDPSRKHFREIIEYLDMSETPYEIDPLLIGDNQCYSDTMFALDFYDDEDNIIKHTPLVVQGGRYNNFMQKYTGKPIPAAGTVIILKDKKAPRRSPRTNKAGVPSVYMIQLGFGPKIKSLLLIEEMRKAGIPVIQNLASDSLSEQLRDAEDRKMSHTVIIGQKEYVENSVILRDMNNSNQEQISMDSLISRLKRKNLNTIKV